MEKYNEICQAEFGMDYEGQDSGTQEWVENEYEIQKFESYRQKGRFLNEAEKLAAVTQKIIDNE